MSYEKNYYKSPCKKVYYKKMHYKKTELYKKLLIKFNIMFLYPRSQHYMLNNNQHFVKPFSWKTSCYKNNLTLNHCEKTNCCR